MYLYKYFNWWIKLFLVRRILEKWGESGKDVLDGFNVFFLKVINYLIRIFLYNLIKYSVMLCWFIYCDFVN